jgi:hypothetical protein
MFFVADSSNDSTDTTISSVLDGVSLDFIDGFDPSTAVVLETGLDTGTSQTPVGSDANRQSMLSANNLLDNRMIVSYDSRFISGISGLTPNSSIANNGGGNALNADFALTNATRTNMNSGIENYSTVMVNGIKNGIVQTTSPNTETSYSNIQGPRGNVAAVAPTIKSGLDAEYGLYGGTSTIGGTSVKFIDTTIYVQGINSSVQAQIPVRITKIS